MGRCTRSSKEADVSADLSSFVREVDRLNEMCEDLRDERDRAVEQYQAAHEALSEIIRRHPSGCGVIHGNRPKGWTCLDYERDATEHPKRYSEAFGSEIRAGQHRCDVCVARAAVSFRGISHA